MPGAQYVYMLLCADNTLYTGWTNRLGARLTAHGAGRGAKYTKTRLPVRLVYCERLPDKSAALRRECALKALTRAEKLALIAQGGSLAGLDPAVYEAPSSAAPGAAPAVDIGEYARLGAAADELRRAVFIDEQGVPEDEVFDGLNEQSLHAVVFDNDTPVATARIVFRDGSWEIGLVAVAAPWRGRRLGEAVMQAAIGCIAARGGRVILLSAQKQAAGFYEKLGFRPCGEPLAFESGFVLVPMELRLPPAPRA